MTELRDRNGFSARALEFSILTASRSGEVRGATWQEIDLQAGIWTIPGNRMKPGKEHRLPLSEPALELLEALRRVEGSDYLFPSIKGGQLSDMALQKFYGIWGTATLHNTVFVQLSGIGPAKRRPIRAK